MISADSVTRVERCSATMQRDSSPLLNRSRWGGRCASRPETPHRASFLEPVVPCDCSLVTVSLRSVRLGEICDRQSSWLSRCHRPVDRDGRNAFPVDETSAPHADGRDVTRCDRPNCRNTAAANEWSQGTGHSSPAENNRIFLKLRLCDGPPLARWTSLRRHPAKRPHACRRRLLRPSSSPVALLASSDFALLGGPVHLPGSPNLPATIRVTALTRTEPLQRVKRIERNSRTPSADKFSAEEHDALEHCRPDDHSVMGRWELCPKRSSLGAEVPTLLRDAFITHAATALILTPPTTKPVSPNSSPAQLAPEFWITVWPELTAAATDSAVSRSQQSADDDDLSASDGHGGD